MERKDTYRRKLSVIAEELDAIPADPTRLTALERRGLLHAIQVAIDAAMDLAAMRVRDLGREVEDDYHNLATLQDATVIDEAMTDELRRLNGLRNAIVHKYNRFEERTVLENVDDIRDTLVAFAKIMEATL